ncbi:MAG: N-acetylneuraminic acid synthase [Candidatus Sericytochromatia bacterium]|nr:MAG: N-acetylneuraminic acid synthase [Candidatus Sericytochromatia bacterium]
MFIDFNKTFIIAELSCNHVQDLSIAKETIYAIKESGADAVKLQTYTPDTMTIDSKKDYFMIKQDTLWDGKTFYDLYKEAYTPWEWHYELKELTEKLDMVFFSTPSNKDSVDFLEELNIPIYKIASFEITDIPLIEYVASKQKPIILSTGIAALSDIEDAINACKRMGNNNFILLKCTSAYPAPFEEMNLKTIPNLSETFNCPVGLSDHTLGISVPIAAVALGAKLIEKHFILSKDLPSHDKEFSLEPYEFKEMVKAIREVEKALGNVCYDLNEKTKKSREFSRSLFVVKDIKEGDVFTEENIKSIRPGYGLHPKYFKDILGKRAKFNLEKGTPLFWDMIF